MNIQGKVLVGTLWAVLSVLVVGCGKQTPDNAAEQVHETAAEFVARVNREFDEIGRELNAADWVRATYINDDTAILSAKANEKYSEFHSRVVKEAKRYAGEDLDPETARAIKLLTLQTSEPAPDNSAKRAELTRITTDMAGTYGAGKYCRKGSDECSSLGDLEKVLAESRDYEENLEAWTGWRTVSPPMRPGYERFVELANEGATELGFGNLGEMWQSGYDMSPVEFQAETSRLWEQVKPLYDELHCHVRAKLAEQYGEDKVPLDQPIPAHLLGNMWSQQWGNIYDLVEPYPGVADLDVDRALAEQNYSAIQMVEQAEDFFVSLGLPELPDSFYERSLLTEPADRDVVCHASAWPMDGGDDVRIKMCIKPHYEMLTTIYHELGHIYYYLAYKGQPSLFRGGAHDGFHEGIGDTIVLSMTPQFLNQLGLVDSVESSEQATINTQMKMALDKIAFLPFGKLIDEWRWGVFSGDISPAEYNAAWWELREKYQGVSAPVARSEADFDPGAKHHIPGNTPYARYFLAHILQFQFQRSLCQAAGHEGELSDCSIYGSKQAGERLEAMLSAGVSEPWQDTLEKLSGTREMDATAIIDYFAPLMGWLKEQNKGRSCGW